MLAHDIAQIPRGFIHLRGKRAGCDTRDQNAIFYQSRCESLGQVDDRRLGGLIAIGFPGVQPQAVDRGDINYLCWLLIRCAGFQQAVHCLGQEKD